MRQTKKLGAKNQGMVTPNNEPKRHDVLDAQGGRLLIVETEDKFLIDRRKSKLMRLCERLVGAL
jgi:hypothetical protein